jgi:hypothetical protein
VAVACGVSFPFIATLPMICGNCNAVFPSSFVIEGEARDIRLSNVSVGPPCPVCGSMGWIPDGLFESVDGVVLALEAPGGAEGLEQLEALLEQWQREPPSPAEAVETLRAQAPPLAAFLERYAPTDSASLATWIMVLVMIVQLFRGCHEQGQQVTVQDIDRVTIEAVDRASQEAQRRPAAPGR